MDKLLQYQHVSFNNLVITDKGSGAKNDMSTWRPDLPEGWFYLGQAASPGYTTSPRSVIVKALQPDVLKDVAGWELVWKSEGSRKPLTCALWRGIPPSDEYAVVGGIFSTNANWAPPTQDQTSGIKAVRKDALTVLDGSSLTGTISKIWLDKGSGSTQHGSVWTVVPHTDYPSDVCYPFSMIPAGDDVDWNPPSLGNCYILSANRTAYVTDALLAYQCVPAKELLASDRGSRDRCNLAIWGPELPEGWFNFGGLMMGDDINPPLGVIFMGLQPDILKDVVSWKLDYQWNTEGWGTGFIYSTWVGTPPSGPYQVQSGIDSILPNQSSSPPENQTKGVKAFRRDVADMLMAQGILHADEIRCGFLFPPDAA